MEDKKILVLVVDDESDFRQLMTFWLESKGYLVITATDGENAIRLVKEKKPDIIFIDLRMPVLDGVEAIKRIRQFNEEIPVIIISAYINDPRLKEVESYNISGEFCKEEDFEKGLTLLEAALRTHKQLKK